jgi:hypothetical protein
MIRNILIITMIAALVPTAMSNVSASASTEIALFSSDSDFLLISGNGDNAKMKLKATNENGKTNKVSDFQLTADNVLNIKTGDKVDVKDNAVFTKAITTDAGNNQKVIGITSDGVIDFAGYNQGAYTLDVVVDDDRAYEAIIGIGGHAQESVKSVNKEITYKIYYGNFTGGGGNNTRGNNTSGGGSGNMTIGGGGGSNMTIGGGGGGNNMTETGNFAGSSGGGGSNMTQGITEFATMPVEPGNPCLEDPQSEECEQIRSKSCDALGCPGYPIVEPEPEPIECDEGEELVDGQCQPIATNPVEPDDPVAIDDYGNEGDDSDDNSDDSNDGGSGDGDEGGDEDNGEDNEDSEGEADASEDQDSGGTSE